MNLTTASFRERFQAFFNIAQFPDTRIETAFERALCWLKIPECAAECGEPYYLLAAHFIALDELAKKGGIQYALVSFCISCRAPPHSLADS